MKNQKGITLIALVITIIVLIILAGVSIAMLTGDNGILTNANTSKEETDISAAKERINMELNAFSTDIRVDHLIGADTWDAATAAFNNANGAGTFELNPSSRPTTAATDDSSELTITYSTSDTNFSDANNGTVTGKVNLYNGKVTKAEFQAAP